MLVGRQWLSRLGLYCSTAPVSLCPIPLCLIYCACSLTSTDGSTRKPKKPVMEHADEAQQEIFWSFLSIFPVFSAMAVSGHSFCCCCHNSRQEGCSGCTIEPRWPQANVCLTPTERMPSWRSGRWQTVRSRNRSYASP